MPSWVIASSELKTYLTVCQSLLSWCLWKHAFKSTTLCYAAAVIKACTMKPPIYTIKTYVTKVSNYTYHSRLSYLLLCLTPNSSRWPFAYWVHSVSEHPFLLKWLLQYTHTHTVKSVSRVLTLNYNLRRQSKMLR